MKITHNSGISLNYFLCTFSGPVEVSESIEPEVSAMLVGCRHLRMFGGYNAIIEGDYFFVIQWGSGKDSYPWRLVDWAEEVRYIYSQLNCIFIHSSVGRMKLPMYLLEKKVLFNY